MSDTPVEKKDTPSVPTEKATDKQSVPKAPTGMKNIQVHAGNIGPLTVQMLGEINLNIARLARCAEIFLKETYPDKIKTKVEQPPEKEKDKPNG